MKGNAPTVPSKAKPFGENDVVIEIYNGATGFGKKWCGYDVNLIIILFGDVNGDGSIDVRDAVILAQYLAEWSVKIDSDSADCNGDGKINISDIVLLAQYLAHWNVSLGGDIPQIPDPDPDPDPEQNPATGEDNEVEV